MARDLELHPEPVDFFLAPFLNSKNQMPRIRGLIPAFVNRKVTKDLTSKYPPSPDFPVRFICTTQDVLQDFQNNHQYKNTHRMICAAIADFETLVGRPAWYSNIGLLFVQSRFFHLIEPNFYKFPSQGAYYQTKDMEKDLVNLLWLNLDIQNWGGQLYKYWSPKHIRGLSCALMHELGHILTDNLQIEEKYILEMMFQIILATPNLSRYQMKNPLEIIPIFLHTLYRSYRKQRLSNLSFKDYLNHIRLSPIFRNSIIQKERENDEAILFFKRLQGAFQKRHRNALFSQFFEMVIKKRDSNPI